MLGIRNLGPGFQIPRQSNRHPGIIRPLDFDLLRLRVIIIKLVVCGHHNRQASFEETTNFGYRLGIWKSRLTVNESKAMEHNDPEHKRPESWQSLR